MSDHAKPGRPRIFGRSHGIHNDDPLFSDDDQPVAAFRAEPVEPIPAPLFRDEVIKPVERTVIMDDDWRPAEHHRAKIVASGLTMAALAVIMGWSFVSIFAGNPVDHANAYAAPSYSASPSGDPSVPVAVVPTSPSGSGPAPAAPRPAAGVKPLSEPQSQDLRGVTQPGRPALDHESGDYPELTRRYLCTPTPRPTHRPPSNPPPTTPPTTPVVIPPTSTPPSPTTPVTVPPETILPITPTPTPTITVN